MTPRHYVICRSAPPNPANLTDPRCYNIRWLELLNELKPRLESYPSVL